VAHAGPIFKDRDEALAGLQAGMPPPLTSKLGSLLILAKRPEACAGDVGLEKWGYAVVKDERICCYGGKPEQHVWICSSLKQRIH
jgi:hypothetical protein